MRPRKAAVKPSAPQSFADLNAAAERPFNEAMGIISRADSALVERWGRSLWPNFGAGYLHSSDHYAALKVLYPDREPTYRRVYDSYHKEGSRNIDAARVKSSGGERPAGWEEWTDQQKLYGVLVHLYGITKGSKILDGAKDPDPEKTRLQLEAWGGKAQPVPPPVVGPGPVTPEPAVAADLILTLDGKVRRFREIL